MEDSVRCIITRERRTFLNDALEMGPNFLPEILAVLLRFRLQHSAIVGNIYASVLATDPE
jgi:hypothetical protein